MAAPLDIAHLVKESALEIAWDDGARTRVSAGALRGWCPCASCQGHTPGVRFVPPPAGVTVAALHEVGAYALGVRFSDGHESGIYTWSHLRRISEPV